jgi:hypothetical protein
VDLRELQAPLNQRYREQADAARITLEASATERYCTVLQTLRRPPPVESGAAG